MRGLPHTNAMSGDGTAGCEPFSIPSSCPRLYKSTVFIGSAPIYLPTSRTDWESHRGRGANHRNWARRSLTPIEASDPTVGASTAAPCPQFDWEVAEKGAQTSGTGLEGSNALIGASKPIIGASAAASGSVEDSPDPIVP